ncbi:MAG: NADH-quinone oxidoreductase subunit J [Myxococcota bacterium]
MMADIGFAIVAGLVVLTSGLVTQVRNLVHAVFWLAATLLASSVLMIWLGAPFVAGIQIVLYTGGVITLMIFAVMLTSREASTFVPNPVHRPGAAAVASLTLLAILTSAIWNTPELEPEVVAARSIPALRTFEAHLLVEQDLEIPEAPAVAEPAEGEESSEPVLEESSSEDRRATAFSELRSTVASALEASGAREISANDDDLEPVARLWLALDDHGEASREAAVERIAATGVRVTELEMTAQVGRQLLTDHLLAFEALSVLLLAAMIGAIVLSRRKDP